MPGSLGLFVQRSGDSGLQRLPTAVSRMNLSVRSSVARLRADLPTSKPPGTKTSAREAFAWWQCTLIGTTNLCERSPAFKLAGVGARDLSTSVSAMRLMRLKPAAQVETWLQSFSRAAPRQGGLTRRWLARGRILACLCVDLHAGRAPQCPQRIGRSRRGGPAVARARSRGWIVMRPPEPEDNDIKEPRHLMPVGTPASCTDMARADMGKVMQAA